MKVGIRWNESSQTSDGAYSATEAASLLFYYLFDDWLSTYGLIARREHPYRDKLEQLREAMTRSAKVDLVSQIHNVGRQLTVLKLMYQSYELIVWRLLHRQRLNKNAMGRVQLEHHSRSDDGAELFVQREHVSVEGGSGATVVLSLSAETRFERLLDRIRLYALTEIEECLKEKESMTFMVRTCPSRRTITDPQADFQLGRLERIPSCRATNANHDPASQSHDSFPPSQPDDGIFLNPTP
jgi:hypothetical protein